MKKRILLATTLVLALAFAGCEKKVEQQPTNSQKQEVQTQDNKTQEPVKKEESNKGTQPAPTPSSDTQNYISLDKAIETFKNTFGESELKNIEFKNEDGIKVYDIDGFNQAKNLEFEIRINAIDGTIIKQKQDNDNDLHLAINFNDNNNLNTAMKSIQETYPNLAVNSYEIKTDDNNNTLTKYEFKLRNENNLETEVKVYLDSNGTVVKQVQD